MFGKKAGFTTWEVIVVLAVAAVLIGLAVLAVSNQARLSRDYKRVADINQIKAALTLYHADLSKYPDKVEEGGRIVGEVDNTVYMQQVPSNPTPGGAPYAYQATDDLSSYTLTFALEGDLGDLRAGPHSVDPNGLR